MPAPGHSEQVPHASSRRAQASTREGFCPAAGLCALSEVREGAGSSFAGTGPWQSALF